MVNATGGGGEKKMKTSSSMRQIANVAYGGLLAYGTVYDGLEKSAKVLGSSLQKESVQVVEHQVRIFYIINIFDFKTNKRMEYFYLLIMSSDFHLLVWKRSSSCSD